MDDESGEFMERAELVYVGRSQSKMERPSRGCRREAGSWFQTPETRWGIAKRSLSSCVSVCACICHTPVFYRILDRAGLFCVPYVSASKKLAVLYWTNYKRWRTASIFDIWIGPEWRVPSSMRRSWESGRRWCWDLLAPGTCRTAVYDRWTPDLARDCSPSEVCTTSPVYHHHHIYFPKTK